MSVFLVTDWSFCSSLFPKWARNLKCYLFLFFVFFVLSSSWNDQPQHASSAEWSFQLMAVCWSCVPALMWVWFIIHSKPWVGQRPGGMEGTSTTGAFPSLVTVKRKGDTSKHSSSSSFSPHQPALHCITFPAHIQEQTPVTPLLMSSYSRLWWYKHWPFLVQICAFCMWILFGLRSGIC